MRNLFILTTLLIAFHGAAAQSSAIGQPSPSPTPNNRAYLEFELNGLAQSIQAINVEIAYLKGADQEVSEALASVDQRMNTKPSEPMITLFNVLKELKVPADDAALSAIYQDNQPFKKESDAVSKAFEYQSVMPFLRDLSQMITRMRNNTVLTPALEKIPIPNSIVNGIILVDHSAIGKLSSHFQTPYGYSSKFREEYQAALDQAEKLPQEWESQATKAKEEIRDYLGRVKTIISTRLNALQQEKSRLSEQAKVNTEQISSIQSNVNSVIDKLPQLVAFLCALFIGLILLIRFYPPQLQVEWVASGQVIQLLTVVTLLLIILCLAVAHLIQENTIGTLLGGIGGYVLSQGVGRAAAREANRSHSPEAHSSPTQEPQIPANSANPKK